MDIVTANGSCSCMSDKDIIRKLREIDPGYSLLYQIGIGTGADLEQLLMLNVSDVAGKNCLSLPVGPLRIRRTYNFPAEVIADLNKYIRDRSGLLFALHDGTPITEISATEIMRRCGIHKSFLHLLLRHYYEETNDIYYPQHMLQMNTTETTLKELY